MGGGGQLNFNPAETPQNGTRYSMISELILDQAPTEAIRVYKIDLLL
jgi:hypothetical protein